MPSHWKHRILYAGRDEALTSFLKDKLKRLDCFVVRSPGCDVHLFIESEIKYSLLIFDEKVMDTTGAELEQFTRSLEHRKLTPVIIYQKSDDFNVLLETVICELSNIN